MHQHVYRSNDIVVVLLRAKAARHRSEASLQHCQSKSQNVLAMLKRLYHQSWTCKTSNWGCTVLSLLYGAEYNPY